MNPSHLPDPTAPPKTGKVRPKRARRVHIPNLLGIAFAVLIVGVLVGLALPLFNTSNVKGIQIRSLERAKGIGLALKIFASDHNGTYPRQGVPIQMRAAPKTSNEAFACLFPEFVQSETLFGNPQSAYQTHPPDNVLDNSYTGQPVRTLEPGENVYAYAVGLSDDDNPICPLVVDGTDGTGHYVTDPTKLGGVWKGQRAIVIHLDNSGTCENLVGSDNARYLPRSANDRTQNLLDMKDLNAKARLLDPAVAAAQP